MSDEPQNQEKEKEIKEAAAQEKTLPETGGLPQPEAPSKAETLKEEAPKAETQKEERKEQRQQPSQERGGARQKSRRGRRPPMPGQEQAAPEFSEKVVAINRITKVTKGGKKLSFSALVVVGDAKGRVGYCLDKAGEVAVAIQKALAGAKKNMIRISLNGTTIPHQIDGVCSGSVVMLKPAAKGTGVIAAGPVRAVCDAVGIHDILTKCHRSNNPINVVKATIDGLSRLKPKKNFSPKVSDEKDLDKKVQEGEKNAVA
jgi:small subunit ribosomal protein S5